MNRLRLAGAYLLCVLAAACGSDPTSPDGDANPDTSDSGGDVGVDASPDTADARSDATPDTEPDVMPDAEPDVDPDAEPDADASCDDYGVPDTCDICLAGDDALDDDEDGTPNACDLCADFPDFIDIDGDGVPIACDLCEGSDDALDEDGDGVSDGGDACPGSDDSIDGDEDGIPDASDVCPDDADTTASAVEDIGARAYPVPFVWRAFEEDGTVAGDDRVDAVEIGFDFSLFGETHTSVNIAVNGHLHFGSTDSSFGDVTLPYTPGDGTLISGFRTDLNSGIAGTLSYGTSGDAPNRVFVAEWDEVAHHSAPEFPRVSMQIVLFEGGGAEVHCLDCPSWEGDWSNATPHPEHRQRRRDGGSVASRPER